ncbi:four helix bundle protein [Tenacibaculum sp. MAR_2009_124]|uniref:four helix bundle protein n=1 Tax=Tenacibaculum sp. MAR_2009_124 TaxID=1250059 RepID=UPI00397B19D3
MQEGPSRVDKGFSHFMDISLGSSFKLETQLIIALKRNYITKKELTKIEERIVEFHKMAMSFQKKL